MSEIFVMAWVFFLSSGPSGPSVLPRIKSGVRAGGRPCERCAYEESGFLLSHPVIPDLIRDPVIPEKGAKRLWIPAFAGITTLRAER